MQLKIKQSVVQKHQLESSRDLAGSSDQMPHSEWRVSDTDGRRQNSQSHWGHSTDSQRMRHSLHACTRNTGMHPTRLLSCVTRVSFVVAFSLFDFFLLSSSLSLCWFGTGARAFRSVVSYLELLQPEGNNRINPPSVSREGRVRDEDGRWIWVCGAIVRLDGSVIPPLIALLCSASLPHHARP